MSAITYGPVKTPFEIPVYLDGQRVGAIRFSRDGHSYFYKPKTGKRGRLFELLHEVKRDIEGPPSDRSGA